MNTPIQTDKVSAGSAPVRLLVVDDHSLFRRGLIALLAQDGRFEVVGEAGDANAAQTAARRLQPDLILLDNHMPGVQGVHAIAGLKEVAPQARILMLTVSENVQDMAAGLRAGPTVTCSRPFTPKICATRSARYWTATRWSVRR